MARIRSVKPGFFTSEEVSALSFRARLLWIGLWTYCDDHGRGKLNNRLIKAAVWPLDNVSLADIQTDLDALVDHARIVTYTVEGIAYLAVVNWHAHQSVNRPSRPKHPGPPKPLGASDPGDENYCAQCALPGPAPAEHYASEPRGTAHASPRDASPKAHGSLPDDPPVDNRPGNGIAGQYSHGPLTEASLRTHGSLTEDSHREGKGRERKGGDTRAPARETDPAGPSTQEPPRRCPQHLDDPDPPACRRCAEARLEHAQWKTDRDAQAVEYAEWLRTAPRCRRHLGEYAHNCRACRADRLAAPEPEVARADPEPPERCPDHLTAPYQGPPGVHCVPCRKAEHAHGLWRIRTGGPIGTAHTPASRP